MDFFTKELIGQLNSGDPKLMEKAIGAWEGAIGAYRAHLKNIEADLPKDARAFSENHVFHDAQLITFSYTEAEQFVVILRDGNNLRVVVYALCGAPSLGEPDALPHFTPEGKHWLYDEFHVDATRGPLHYILFSDGSEVVVPFLQISVHSFEVHPIGTSERLRELDVKKSRTKKKRSAKPLPKSPPKAKAASTLPSVVSPDLSSLDHLTPVFTVEESTGVYRPYGAALDAVEGKIGQRPKPEKPAAKQAKRHKRAEVRPGEKKKILLKRAAKQQ